MTSQIYGSGSSSRTGAYALSPSPAVVAEAKKRVKAAYAAQDKAITDWFNQKGFGVNPKLKEVEDELNAALAALKALEAVYRLPAGTTGGYVSLITDAQSGSRALEGQAYGDRALDQLGSNFDAFSLTNSNDNATTQNSGGSGYSGYSSADDDQGNSSINRYNFISSSGNPSGSSSQSPPPPSSSLLSSDDPYADDGNPYQGSSYSAPYNPPGTAGDAISPDYPTGKNAGTPALSSDDPYYTLSPDDPYYDPPSNQAALKAKLDEIFGTQASAQPTATPNLSITSSSSIKPPFNSMPRSFFDSIRLGDKFLKVMQLYGGGYYSKDTSNGQMQDRHEFVLTKSVNGVPTPDGMCYFLVRVGVINQKGFKPN